MRNPQNTPNKRCATLLKRRHKDQVNLGCLAAVRLRGSFVEFELFHMRIATPAAFGVAAGVASVIALTPYLWGILFGRTRPQQTSWFIWSILSTIAFFSQAYEGADHSLWFAGVQCSGTVVVLALSCTKGKAAPLRPADTLTLLAAGIGIALWSFTENAAWALAITIFISLLGGVRTISGAYQDPAREPMMTWSIFTIASVLAILAVGKIDWVLLAYPVYLLVLNGAVVLAILLGNSRRHMPA